MNTIVKKISTLNLTLTLLSFMLLSSGQATADEFSTYGITSVNSCDLIHESEDKKSSEEEEEEEPDCE